MSAATIIGALIRWLCRRCKTKFRDEYNCVDGWFSNIPILGDGDFENLILSQCFVLVVIFIVSRFI